MRTFIAIELPARVQSTLGQLQERLITQFDSSGRVARVRWSSPENIHLTLRFLGETDREQAATLRQQLAGICESGTAFALNLAGLGCFPNHSRPRVIWVGIGGDVAALQALQNHIETGVLRAGFEAETRPFSPHITLGRIHRHASLDDVRRLGRILQAIIEEGETDLVLTTAGGITTFPVQGITHMRSELHPSGARYSAIRRFHFNNVVWEC
jgi:2'-5' RNA ligase